MLPYPRNVNEGVSKHGFLVEASILPTFGVFCEGLIATIVDTIYVKHSELSLVFHTIITPVDNKSGHMNWKRALGTQIKEARESAGLTQAELATHVDVSRQMVSRYEAGQDAPAVDVLVEIARVLEIEFQVKGMLIRFEQGSGRPRLLPKQFKLEFEKARRFDRVQVEITPTEGKIIIKAEIPA